MLCDHALAPNLRSLCTHPSRISDLRNSPSWILCGLRQVHHANLHDSRRLVYVSCIASHALFFNRSQSHEAGGLAGLKHEVGFVSRSELAKDYKNDDAVLQVHLLYTKSDQIA